MKEAVGYWQATVRTREALKLMLSIQIGICKAPQKLIN
jgi:hypothetical protein